MNKTITVNFISLLIKLTGLLCVALTIGMVTTWKFDVLTSYQGIQTESMVTAAERTKQLACLTQNIYFEAGHEPFEGKVAVAQVTLNRVGHDGFADTVCGVVYEKNIVYKKVICQFSWYCEPKKVTPVNSFAWIESEEVAKKVLLENFRLPSLEEAIFYHADYVNPRWSYPKITKIGRHIFYGEKPTQAKS